MLLGYGFAVLVFPSDYNGQHLDLSSYRMYLFDRKVLGDKLLGFTFNQAPKFVLDVLPVLAFVVDLRGEVGLDDGLVHGLHTGFPLSFQGQFSVNLCLILGLLLGLDACEELLGV